MTVLSILVPTAILGLIIWVVTGTRRATREPLGAAGVGIFYANLMKVATATVALVGGGVLVKAVVGFINVDYAYVVPVSGETCSSSSSGPFTCMPNISRVDFAPQRSQDLVLGLTLVGAGLLVFAFHAWFAASLRARGEAPPGWLDTSTSLAYVVLWAPAALFGLIASVYAILVYFVVPDTAPSPGAGFGGNGPHQPWAELLGAALMFVPAWAVAVARLRRRIPARSAHPTTPALPPATAT
ncbi:MAG: hypothetical protein ACYDAC_05840 [Candidatus Dormibacteria bacterium]